MSGCLIKKSQLQACKFGSQPQGPQNQQNDKGKVCLRPRPCTWLQHWLGRGRSSSSTWRGNENTHEVVSGRFLGHSWTVPTVKKAIGPRGKDGVTVPGLLGLWPTLAKPSVAKTKFGQTKYGQKKFDQENVAKLACALPEFWPILGRIPEFWPPPGPLHQDRSDPPPGPPRLRPPLPLPRTPPPPPPADLENKIWPKLVRTWFGQSWCWPNLVWPNFVKQLGQTSFGQSWFRQSWFRPLVGLLYKHPRRGGRDAVRSTVGRRFPLAPVPFQGILGTGIAVTAEMLLENRILSKTKLWVSFSGGDVLANGIQTRSQMGEFGHLSQKKRRFSELSSPETEFKCGPYRGKACDIPVVGTKTTQVSCHISGTYLHCVAPLQSSMCMFCRIGICD